MAQDAQLTEFNIPAGPLNRALAAFGAQSGTQLSYEASIAGGLSSPGLRGALSREAALAQILQGSDLVYSFAGERNVVISKPDSSLDQAGAEGAAPLGTIVLQGEKFARDQFNTFSSVAVVTAGDLDDYARPMLDEALNSSPNVRITERDGATGIVIRGINAEGTTQPNRSDPVISVTVDGAQQNYEATRAGTRGIWDVEQIEVLRGPQSTLQGRNALAGSVVIKTKDPSFTPEASIRAGADTANMRSGAFAVTGPIVEDQLAFRLSGQVMRGKNDITYADPGYASHGEEEFEEFRGKLLFTPSDMPGFTALFSASRTHDKPAHNLVLGPDYFDRRYASTATEFRDTVVERYIADLKYEIGADLTLQSLTTFVDTTVGITTPAAQAGWWRDETRHIQDISQDFTLSFGTGESAFSGVVGVYAGKSKNHSTGQTDYDLFVTGTAIPFQIIERDSTNTSLALYADSRYQFADRWTLLAGARLVHDRVSATYRGDVLPGTFLHATLDEVSSSSSTAFLPRLGLAFELSENQNLALTASKGYRPGFSEIIVGTTTLNEVKPESLWAYEMAYRSKWLDDRLQISGNLFYYDYTDMQVPVAVPGMLGMAYTYNINTGKAHSYGAEIEARWAFDSGLEMFGGLGLIRTRFDEGIFEGSSLIGNEFPEAPAVTASLGGIYRHDSGWFVGGDVAFTEGYYSKGDVRNLPANAVDSYTIVNAQAGYRDERFEFTIYAKNLLDEKYLTSVSGNSASIGDERSFGLQLTRRF
ncbi:TonB-dependent receptor [Xinfangfangia sp. D13-10-4-6]|nr:TonB-dependent receptor [Pseudogemmobacter hezensis]